LQTSTNGSDGWHELRATPVRLETAMKDEAHKRRKTATDAPRTISSATLRHVK
jgi:hypothetical protein